MTRTWTSTGEWRLPRAGKMQHLFAGHRPGPGWHGQKRKSVPFAVCGVYLTDDPDAVSKSPMGGLFYPKCKSCLR